jgi:hypothetical protein
MTDLPEEIVRTLPRKTRVRAVDPGEADSIRRHLQHQCMHGPDRFRPAIERQSGSERRPRNIGWPERHTIETDDLLERRV